MGRMSNDNVSDVQKQVKFVPHVQISMIVDKERVGGKRNSG